MINTYKQYFADALSWYLNLPLEDIFSLIEIPPSNIPWDLAFPCFRISKQIWKSPNDISLQLSQELKSEFSKHWIMDDSLQVDLWKYWSPEIELAFEGSKAIYISIFSLEGELLYANSGMKNLFKGSP